MSRSNAPTIYLDTSDLSNLVKGRHEVERERLLELIEESRVRLRLSYVHAWRWP